MLDKLGEPVEVAYPVVGMKKSETETRKKENYKKEINEYYEKIVSTVQSLEYPSGNDVHKLVGGKKEDFNARIRELIAHNRLSIMPLPAEKRQGAKKDYLLVPS
jgi:predicted HTH transcriptional regulator